MTARLRAVRQSADRGVSLAEVLVASLITMIVLVLVTTSVINGYRLQSASEDESAGMFDIRTTVERLGRDVRQARAVYEGATESQLQLWIDEDSDYFADPSEKITWSLSASATSGGAYIVSRQAEGGVARQQSSLLYDDIAFEYFAEAGSAALGSAALGANADPDAFANEVRLVRTTVRYDARRDVGTGTRSETFTERLRNVE